jgi:phosphoglycolate phosphatase
MSKINTIFFDLDGTLIDSFAGIEYAVKKAVYSVFPSLSIPSLHPFIGPPIEIILQLFLPNIKDKDLQEIITNFRQIYDQEGWKKSICYEGVRETLLNLGTLSKTAFIVTNKPLLPTYQILENLSIKSCFQEVLCPNSLHPPFNSKVEMIKKTIANYQLDPKTCLMVGDSLDDAKAAYFNDIKFIAVNYGYGQVHLKNEFPIACIVSSLTEILKYIN